jgi:hypothetical protein
MVRIVAIEALAMSAAIWCGLQVMALACEPGQPFH